MKRKWKIVFVSVLVLIVLLVLISGLGQELETGLVRVETGSLAVTIREEGKVIPRLELAVCTLSGGKIAELPVTDGQEVKEGDLLLSLDDTELKLQLEQLQSELSALAGEEKKSLHEPYEAQVKILELQLEQARRDLAEAETNLQKIKKLYEEGALTASEYEKSQAVYSAAQNNLEQQEQALSLFLQSHRPDSGLRQFFAGKKRALEAQIDLLQYKLEGIRLLSPLDGIVSQLQVKKGEVVPPGAQVMSIFQKGNYQVESFVLTEDAGILYPGLEVELIQSGRDEDLVFPGTVVKVAPFAEKTVSPLGLEEQRVRVVIEPRLPAGLTIYPGYLLTVRFTLEREENVLLVPKAAVFAYEGGKAVWVVKKGKAQIQQLETGLETDREVLIKKGLEEGDLVIADPRQPGLREGKRIKQK